VKNVKVALKVATNAPVVLRVATNVLNAKVAQRAKNPAAKKSKADAIKTRLVAKRRNVEKTNVRRRLVLFWKTL